MENKELFAITDDNGFKALFKKDSLETHDYGMVWNLVPASNNFSFSITETNRHSVVMKFGERCAVEEGYEIFVNGKKHIIDKPEAEFFVSESEATLEDVYKMFKGTKEINFVFIKKIDVVK